MPCPSCDCVMTMKVALHNSVDCLSVHYMAPPRILLVHLVVLPYLVVYGGVLGGSKVLPDAEVMLFFSVWEDAVMSMYAVLSLVY